MEQIVFKEYSFGKILSESWRLFKENFKLILIITLIVYTPVNIILAVFQLGELPIWKQALTSALFTGLVEIIAAMAIIIVVKSKIDGVPLDLKSAFKKSFSKWPSAVVTNILKGVLLIFLFILLIVPGIIYSVFWMFNLYAVVLSDKSGKGALDYSKSVVKGRWGKALIYGAYISLLVGFFSLIIGFVFSVIFSFIKLIWGKTIFNFLGYTLESIIYSFSQVALTVFFINLDATSRRAPDALTKGNQNEVLQSEPKVK